MLRRVLLMLLMLAVTGCLGQKESAEKTKPQNNKAPEAIVATSESTGATDIPIEICERADYSEFSDIEASVKPSVRVLSSKGPLICRVVYMDELKQQLALFKVTAEQKPELVFSTEVAPQGECGLQTLHLDAAYAELNIKGDSFTPSLLIYTGIYKPGCVGESEVKKSTLQVFDLDSMQISNAIEFDDYCQADKNADGKCSEEDFAAVSKGHRYSLNQEPCIEGRICKHLEFEKSRLSEPAAPAEVVFLQWNSSLDIAWSKIK